MTSQNKNNPLNFKIKLWNYSGTLLLIINWFREAGWVPKMSTKQMFPIRNNVVSHKGVNSDKF